MQQRDALATQMRRTLLEHLSYTQVDGYSWDTYLFLLFYPTGYALVLQLHQTRGKQRTTTTQRN